MTVEVRDLIAVGAVIVAVVGNYVGFRVSVAKLEGRVDLLDAHIKTVDERLKEQEKFCNTIHRNGGES